MEVYITQYALSKGIQKMDGQIEDIVCLISNHFYKKRYYKPDWHITKEKAIERAEQMRLLKIEFFKTQLNKLENLKFEL